MKLIETSEAAMQPTGDPLSDVFDALRLTGGLYFTADLRGEFAVTVPEDRNTVRFHGALSGTCSVRVPGQWPVTLAPGDWAIIPHGAVQTLSLGDASAPVPLPAAMQAGTVTPDGRFLFGEQGTRTTLLCGFCEFRSGFSHPLLLQLPALMNVRRSEIAADAALSTIVDLLSAEGTGANPGKSAVLTRAVETLFMLLIRRMMAAPGSAGGFLSVLADTRLSRSIRAIHRNPETAWTLPDLSRQAGMSRSAFAAAFAEKAGMGPAAYLRLWRMIRARDLLRGTDLDIAEIAQRCGYESLPSFSARFKKETGMGPGAYRRKAKG